MLPRENRLQKSRDFDFVYKKGRFFNTKFFGLKYVKNGLLQSRIGFVVSTKVHKKATKRNLLKRRMREVVRLNLDNIRPGFDVVITSRTGAWELEYREIERDMLFMLKRIELISK